MGPRSILFGGCGETSLDEVGSDATPGFGSSFGLRDRLRRCPSLTDWAPISPRAPLVLIAGSGVDCNRATRRASVASRRAAGRSPWSCRTVARLDRRTATFGWSFPRSSPATARARRSSSAARARSPADCAAVAARSRRYDHSRRSSASGLLAVAASKWARSGRYTAYPVARSTVSARASSPRARASSAARLSSSDPPSCRSRRRGDA
jgi:hypothetical protein